MYRRQTDYLTAAARRGQPLRLPIIIETMLTEADLRDALRDCYDPALPCNLIDLGLLRTLSLTPDPCAPGAGIPGVPSRHQVQVTLTLTSPSDDAEAQVRAQVQNRLAGLEQVSRASVAFDHTLPWTPAQISTEGRRRLGLDGNPALVQIAGSR